KPGRALKSYRRHRIFLRWPPDQRWLHPDRRLTEFRHPSLLLLAPILPAACKTHQISLANQTHRHSLWLELKSTPKDPVPTKLNLPFSFLFDSMVFFARSA